MEFYAEECAPLGDALPTYKERPRELYDPPGGQLPLSIVSYHSKFHPSGAFNEVQTFRDLIPDPYVTVHPDDAAARGITNHSVVEVFNRVGRVKLRARLSEGMRPGTIAIMQGWRRSSFLDGAMQDLLSGDVINPAHVAMNPITGADPNAPLHDVWVEMRKVEA
jgi:molybdopterin-containing oxidoreductase family molybdopterin binding subunit